MEKACLVKRCWKPKVKEKSRSQLPKPAAPAIPERTIEVVSGALTYTLSNRGGVITSVGSRHMKSLKGEAAELVPHEEGTIHPMTLVTDHTGMNKALAQSIYQTDAPPARCSIQTIQK